MHRERGLLVRLQCVFAGFVIGVATLFGQAQYGSIGGTITDITRAVVPGVRFSIINAETGQVSAAISLEDGSYRVPQLLPGRYTIQVEQAGFKRLSITGIQVDINQN